MKTRTSSLMDGKNYTQNKNKVIRIDDINNEVDKLIQQNELLEEHNQRVQKLIDKDIFDQATLAMEEWYGSGCETEIDAYFRGAKWMQQQLNK